MLPHWTQADFQADAVRLHYTRTGNGEKRPIVLVHGFSDNGLCWGPVARELEKDYDVIMPDMRGHGLSARVRPDESVDIAADLAALIRALGLDRPVVCGHSMGAMVTYQIGMRFPELARALVLEDPPFWLSRPVPPPDSSGENPILTWARSLPGRSYDELLAEYTASHPTWPEFLVRAMVDSKKQLDPNIAEVMTARMHLDAGGWLKGLPTIPHPILMLTGDPALGGIVTAEAAERACALHPNLTVVNVPAVGHLIRFDAPVAFMGALRAFLEKQACLEA